MSRQRKVCQICTETLIESKFVTCPYCEFDACTECYKRVILDSINQPTCMGCRKQFSDDFVYSVFPKTWLNTGYRSHVTKNMIEKEKALLPETQPHVERIILIEKMEKEAKELREEIRKMEARYDAMTYEIYNLKNGKVKENEVSHIVCACPKQDCKGYVRNGKCGICDSKVCKDCHELKNEDEHVCNPDSVATVKELAKTTRNCPNCMCPIFKTEGCDQMWCTKCHVAFNWKTGKIEKGVVHNPHYFEYLRQNGGNAPRNPHEVRCGGMPNARNLFDRRIGLAQIPVTQKYGKLYKSATLLLEAIYQKVTHIRHSVMERLPTVIDNNSNLDLRIKYMRNELTIEKFTEQVYRKEKDRKKKLEYRDILDTYCNVMQDLFVKLFNDFQVADFLESESRVSTFVSDSVNRINKKYNSKLSAEVL